MSTLMVFRNLYSHRSEFIDYKFNIGVNVYINGLS